MNNQKPLNVEQLTLIKEEIAKYYGIQRDDIILNLRSYAYNNHELKYMFREINRKMTEEYEKKLKEIAVNTRREMNSLIADVHRKDPYDILDRKFRQNIVDENNNNFSIIWVFLFMLIISNAYLLFKVSKL